MRIHIICEINLAILAISAKIARFISIIQLVSSFTQANGATHWFWICAILWHKKVMKLGYCGVSLFVSSYILMSSALATRYGVSPYVFSKKEIRNSQSNMQTSSISPQNRTRIQSLQIRRDGTCVKKYFSLLAQGYTWASTSIQGFG